jgi:hypothetical protein
MTGTRLGFSPLRRLAETRGVKSEKWASRVTG